MKILKKLIIIKKYWIPILVCIAALGCIANFVLAFAYPDEGGNVFSTVSAWISGIATVVLGYIAFHQSQKYTLLSLKKEIKAEIGAEKKDLIENCANAVKPSSTMGPLLEFMYTKEKWETAQVIYGMQMSVFREELTFKISNIQLHKYIPQNMEKLLEKLASFLEYTYQEYFLYSLQQEDNLFAAYTQISQYLYNLVEEIIAIRNDALMEMELFLKAVQASKSVTELSALLEQKEQETNAARAAVTAMLSQKEKSISKEQKDGQTENAQHE